MRVDDSNQPVDVELVSDFMSRFLGYGNPNASFWFVGLEGGGGSGLAELNKRLRAWDVGGRRSLEDLATFHRRIERTEFHIHPIKLQRTWASLIRCMLAARGKQNATNDEIKRIQAYELGSASGTTVLAELLPLPAPNRGEWPYASLATSLPQLVNRDTYANGLRRHRIEMLHKAIQSSRPEVVLFYGIAELDAWHAICGVMLQPRELCGRRIWLGGDADIVYGIAPHPNTPGLTNHFWQSLGVLLNEVAHVRPTARPELFLTRASRQIAR